MNGRYIIVEHGDFDSWDEDRDRLNTHYVHNVAVYIAFETVESAKNYLEERYPNGKWDEGSRCMHFSLDDSEKLYLERQNVLLDDNPENLCSWGEYSFSVDYCPDF